MTKEERRTREASFPKCACGNTAQRGETMCSRCADEKFNRSLLIMSLHECGDLEALKCWIEGNLLDD